MREWERESVLAWVFIVFPCPVVNVCLFVFFLTAERNRQREQKTIYTRRIRMNKKKIHHDSLVCYLTLPYPALPNQTVQSHRSIPAQAKKILLTLPSSTKKNKDE